METSPTHLPSTLQAQGAEPGLAGYSHHHPWVHPLTPTEPATSWAARTGMDQGSRHSGTLALPVDHLQVASSACHRLLVTFRLLWGYGECRPSEPNTLKDPLGMTMWLALPPAARSHTQPCPCTGRQYMLHHFCPVCALKCGAHKQSQAGCSRHRTVFLFKKKKDSKQK